MSTLERTQDSRERWLLWLLTAAALGLRLWGIAFGLPHLEARPDESKIIDVATRSCRRATRTIARFDVEIPGRREALVYDEQDAFFCSAQRVSSHPPARTDP